ncbi:SDR family oxidoreductase [Hazenella sp. IB182357]|uniref:SDR family oxidoreductase n=1 Tax=Polycladospora coralii TaxID=2771432 RepID=A0A926NAH3_9BACL|nr:SDR family oxidoreductase [Polycladospora coralii]MBD1372863.1 SDR family oxidoreductase [Polycladospora coralii]
MKKILIAGATGYLGRYLVQTFKTKGYEVHVLVRNEKRLKEKGPFASPAIAHLADEVHIGDVCDPATLTGVCEGIDFVCSAVGITRQIGKQTFWDVDYQGNLNLLREAEQAQVKQMMYIHAFQAEQLNNNLTKAKEAFATALKNASLDFIIIKPTGYFSDLTAYLDMAEKGRVYLIGSGAYRLNPIHGQDLANYCAEVLDVQHHAILDIGGPVIYQHQQLAQLAVEATGKQAKVTHIPQNILKVAVVASRLLGPRIHTLAQFFYAGVTRDMVAPQFGTHHLDTYFKEKVNQQPPVS